MDYDVDKVIHLARLTESEGFIPLGRPADHGVHPSLAYAFELLADGATIAQALEELRLFQELEMTGLRSRQCLDCTALQMIAQGQREGYIKRRFEALARALGDARNQPSGTGAASSRVAGGWPSQ